ncbi:MAG: rhodanese-like domain-containing protein [Gemmatimonadales bacterium]
MILERIFDERLAQAGFLVASEKARVALVVDPNRNIDRYIEAASRHNVTITHVTETHIHADFVSGARELAKRTGATLHLSDAGPAPWKYAFAESAHADLLKDGSSFMVGDVRIDALHTPGHTPEHITFLVTDESAGNSPIGALTGDFIFVSDVGRPDLLEKAAGGEHGATEAAARQLFQSLQRFTKYPDHLQIWPGHGAGSACGKSLGSMPQSTLGYEKLFNPGLYEKNEEAFVKWVLSGQPEPPAYFGIMKRVNRDGPSAESALIPRELSPREIAQAIAAGEVVVDTRGAAEFASRHAAGTINIPFAKSFLTWAGSLLPYNRDLFLLVNGDEENFREVAAALHLIGLERIGGAFPSQNLDSLEAENVRLQSTLQVTAVDLASHTNGSRVLDVRRQTEYDAGHIPGALHIPLGELPDRISEIPAGRLYVHCQGGSRSAIAASILRQHGRDDVANLTGGFSEWERTGHPVEREAEPRPG